MTNVKSMSAEIALMQVGGIRTIRKGAIMTNREKFKEVFGFEQDGNPCVAPQVVCNHEDCDSCPFWGWWDKEYLPCFRLKENPYDE